MGYKVEIEVIRRGHYPKGGGLVTVKTHPISRLKPINRVRRCDVVEIQGISHAVKLPSHVAQRQAKAAEDYLKSKGYHKVNIDVETYELGKDPHLGPGSGIVLWAICSNGCILGSDALGAKGKPAEVVGREAAEGIVRELESGMCFDSHMADMLIPYIALAEGLSLIGVSNLTLHALTNIEITERILGVKFEIDGKEGSPSKIGVKGLGYGP